MEEFEIERVIATSGFGLVYLAIDCAFERRVAIKEYFPDTLAVRGTDGLQVLLRAGTQAEAFERGRRAFIEEARLLAQLEHPSLLRVLRQWEGNGTVYRAMPYYPGTPLLRLREAMGTSPDEATLRALLDGLLEPLAQLHAAGCIHREITPSSILLLPDDRPVLMDWGAARRAIVGDQARALMTLLAPSFAPPEVTAPGPDRTQGPWTDLYSLAAVVRYCISGQLPPPASLRTMPADEPIGRLLERLRTLNPAINYSPSFVAAIDAALMPRPEDRPQDVAAMRRLLDDHPASDAEAMAPGFEGWGDDEPQEDTPPARPAVAPASRRAPQAPPGTPAPAARTSAATPASPVPPAAVPAAPPIRAAAPSPAAAREPPPAPRGPAPAAVQRPPEPAPRVPDDAWIRTIVQPRRSEPTPAPRSPQPTPAPRSPGTPVTRVESPSPFAGFGAPAPQPAWPEDPGRGMPTPQWREPWPRSAPQEPGFAPGFDDPADEALRARPGDFRDAPPPDAAQAMRDRARRRTRRRAASVTALALLAVGAGAWWVAEHRLDIDAQSAFARVIRESGLPEIALPARNAAPPASAQAPAAAPAGTEPTPRVAEAPAPVAPVAPADAPPRASAELQTPAPLDSTSPTPTPAAAPAAAASPHASAVVSRAPVAAPRSATPADPPVALTAAPRASGEDAPVRRAAVQRAAPPPAEEAEPAPPPRVAERRGTVSSSGTGSLVGRATAAAKARSNPGPSSPRAACGERTQFALYRCMQSACEKPKWFMHPSCKRLRMYDEVD